MKTYGTNEMRNKGASIVVEQLKKKGWGQVVNSVNQPGPIDVVAADQRKKVIVSVQPTLESRGPTRLASQELNQFKQMAVQNQAEPFQAIVEFKDDMTTVNKVFWERV